VAGCWRICRKTSSRLIERGSPDGPVRRAVAAGWVGQVGSCCLPNDVGEVSRCGEGDAAVDDERADAFDGRLPGGQDRWLVPCYRGADTDVVTRADEPALLPAQLLLLRPAPGRRHTGNAAHPRRPTSPHRQLTTEPRQAHTTRRPVGRPYRPAPPRVLGHPTTIPIAASSRWRLRSFRSDRIRILLMSSEVALKPLLPSLTSIGSALGKGCSCHEGHRTGWCHARLPVRRRPWSPQLP
jgi:hypothetical protein